MTELLSIPRRPVVLVTLDGFGINPSKINNAVAQARTPRLDEYFFRCSFSVLDASGAGVGLPEGQMGNSEVGHMTLGSGCLVRQDLVLIDDAIADGSFFTIPQLHCAETEKYAHVTYFFNGVSQDQAPGEEHHLIPSPRVATYDP